MLRRNLLIPALCCIHTAAALYAVSTLDVFKITPSSAAYQPSALITDTAAGSEESASAENIPLPSANDNTNTEGGASITEADDTAAVSEDTPASRQDMSNSDALYPEPAAFIVKARRNLHIRQEPSLNARIIGRIPPAESGLILKLADNDWAEILYNGIQGYAATDYLDFDITAFAKTQIPAEESPAEDAGNSGEETQPAQETSILIISSCYVRSSPNADTRENIVSTAQSEDVFERMEEYDTPGWYAVHLDGQKTAYVPDAYAVTAIIKEK